MKYALIQGERICEFSPDQKSCFPVAPDLHWIEVADDVTTLDRYADGAVIKFVAPVIANAPPSFLARDFFAQLSVADYAAIKAAVAGSDALGLLWDSLKAQGEAPIVTTSERFQAGWSGLKTALGASRSASIAAVLNIPNG